MGISKKTCREVFDIVSKSGISSRKEISEKLGISTVAVHNAVEMLVSRELLSVEKDSLHNTSPRGRKSEDVVVSRERLALLVDFCKKNIYFSISPLCSRIGSFEIIPYSDMLDAEVNFDIAASEIFKFIERNNVKPSFVAIAVPTFDDNFSVKDCKAALSKVGLSPDMIVSGASAASELCSSLSNERFVFVSIDNRAWGCHSAEPERMIPWDSIKVGAHHGESFASVLQYESDEQKLSVYANRFIGAIDAVLSPERIFVSATALPEAVVENLKKNDKISDISAEMPVLNGLLGLSKNIIFNQNFNN